MRRGILVALIILLIVGIVYTNNASNVSLSPKSLSVEQESAKNYCLNLDRNLVDSLLRYECDFSNSKLNIDNKCNKLIICLERIDPQAVSMMSLTYRFEAEDYSGLFYQVSKGYLIDSGYIDS